MKNIIIGIIIGGIIFTLGGVVATTAISSTNVTYQNKTVNNALDELYNEAVTGKELVAAAITNKGITTTSTDTYETMATNINSIDTDHTEINQKLSNLESKHNSDIASLSGSISNLNQSLTNIVDSRNMYTFLSCAKMKTISLLYTDSITINANIWTTLLNIPEKPITNTHSSASDASGNSYLIRLTVDGNLQVYSNKTITTSYIAGNITYL